jgi:hypothetical protein
MITVIRGITLVEGRGADPLHNAALAFLKKASQFSVPRDARVIEADGLFLLPGLMERPAVGAATRPAPDDLRAEIALGDRRLDRRPVPDRVRGTARALC